MAKKYDKISMLDIMRDNYMIYAKSTILDRSFPFIDGYKPVQRKILYSMHELGLENHAAKSARVVGDVMGKYHAHGDCLDADTVLFQTNGEFLTIEEAYKKNEDLEILAVDIKTGKLVPAIAKHFRIGQYTDRIYHIELSNGSEIKCTNNHPILMNDLSFVKAENLNIGDKLFSKYYSLSKDKRPLLSNEFIQDIVFNYLNDKLPKGYIKHHKDENVMNNNSSNLVKLTRAEHALLHKNYNEGLDNGRVEMFSKNGKFYEETKLKNSRLKQIYNRDSSFRYFKSIVNDIKDDNNGFIDEKIYESYRGKKYNLPKISNLIAKGKYGNTFDELVNFEMPSVGEIYTSEYGSVKDKKNNRKVKSNEQAKNLKFGYAKDHLTNLSYFDLIDENSYEIYKDIASRKYKNILSLEDFEFYKKDYLIKHLYVKNIWIEYVEQIPMYDFTVDDFENMLIPTFGDNGTKTFISIHNSSIYEAMCQMGDSVESRNAAEIQAKGCFGKSWSTFSVPKAASRYCVSGKSMVSTNLGLYKIEDLAKFADDENIDIYVKGYSDKNYHVSKFFDSGEHDVITIKLKNGMELTGTYNHPVMVLNDKVEFSWKLLPELKVGDKVLLSRYDNDLFGSNDDILEAKMLGCMISKGYVTTQNRIGMNNTDIEMIKPVKLWFDKQIDTQANINDTGKGWYEYCIANKELYTIFIEKYQYSSKVENKKIPQCVFNGTREYIKNFLSYLFEGDGTAFADKESPRVMYSTYSKELVNQLQVLLLQSFGILSTISLSKEKEYKLYISSLDLERFRDRIGFISNTKKEKLDECVSIYKSKNRIASNSYYTNSELSHYLHSILSHTWIDKGYSYGNIKNIERCKNDVSDEQYKHFYDLVSNYVNVEIKKIIKEKEPQRVYSLKVDDESHSFCANGFINHNTEAKLTKLVADCHFKGLHKDAVDFIENYDNTLKEPLLLPVVYPNIIVNTSSGVACGIRTYIPSYTLKNACEATIGLLNGKIKTLEALADALDAPDFQTGGIINMTAQQKIDLVTTGATKGIYITSRYKFDTKKNEMTIYEIPYNTTVEKITSQIEECIKERKIQGITRVVNGADKDGLGIVVFIQRGYNVEDVFKYLCAYTDVQTKISFQTKFIHIDPETGSMNYKEVGIYELLDSYWIPWRMEVIRRMNRFELRKLEEDRHKLSALDIVGDRIREYVDIVLDNTRKEAREKHLATFPIDEIQEDYMLGCSIDSLTIDGVLRARDKINKLTDDINRITTFISDEKAIKKQMIDELNMVIKKHAIPRKSSSEDIGTLVHLTKEEATAISDEEVWVGITEKCRLKKAMTEKDADNFESKVDSSDKLWVTYQMNNKDNLLVYTTAGCIYKLPVNSLDSSARTNFKDSAWRFINKDSEDVHRELERKSDIFFISPLGKGKDGFNIVYTDGMVKKIRYDAYTSKRKVYKKSFPEYDNRGFIVDYDEMLLMTTMGRALVTDVSHLLDGEKPTKGSTLQRLPKLREGEEVCAVYCIDDLRGFIDDETIEYYRKKYWVRAKRGAYDITKSIKLMKLALTQKSESTEEEIVNEFISDVSVDPVVAIESNESNVAIVNEEVIENNN